MSARAGRRAPGSARRRAASASVAQARPPAATRAPQPRPVEESGRHISWRHCLLGWLVGEVLLLVLTNGGLDLANWAFGGLGDRIDGGIVGVGTFVAVIAGGYLAGRLAGRWEIYQGIVVAIGFIVVSVVYQFVQEASIVHQALAGGSRTLVDLGPMRIDNVVSGDLLVLFGGSFGGWLARR